MNIFEALREDHDKQRKLVKLLLETEGKSESRDKLFDKLNRQLTDHAAAEERFFYSPLMKHDITQDMARHSVAEHKELEDMVEELEEMDMSSPSWLKAARKLCKRLIHHLDEEEQEVFQLAGKALSDEQKSSLAESYRDLMASD